MASVTDVWLTSDALHLTLMGARGSWTIDVPGAHAAPRIAAGDTIGVALDMAAFHGRVVVRDATGTRYLAATSEIPAPGRPVA